MEKQNKSAAVEIIDYANRNNGSLSVIDDTTIKCTTEKTTTIFYLDVLGRLLGYAEFNRNHEDDEEMIDAK